MAENELQKIQEGKEKDFLGFIATKVQE